MIISASRRTDIPAFFGDWFMNRIREGYFVRVNPMNPEQKRVFSLKRDDVDAVVFWTKYPRNFFPHVVELLDLGYNFYFQYTLNKYPAVFEPNVPGISKRIDIFRRLSRKIGKEKVIWRYDPVIFSNVTDESFHLENIEIISDLLAGHTERVFISFLDFYGKVKRRLAKIESENSIRIFDVVKDENRERLFDFASKISEILKPKGIIPFTCSEKFDFTSPGIKPGSCVDGKLINRIFGLKRNFGKDPNQRDMCGCSKSIDVGMYNCCKFECSYCYANLNSKTIADNIGRHNTQSPQLMGEYNEDCSQLKLFP